VETAQPIPTTPVAPPRGFYPGRVDEKGRLKLPVKFQEYLAGVEDKSFFVTSFGDGVARIYPESVWKDNEKLFHTTTVAPQAAQRLAFLANALGADCEIDAQGRMLLPPELRRKLGLENQPVQLLAYRGRIDVYSQEMYYRHLADAEAASKDDLALLAQNGLL